MKKLILIFFISILSCKNQSDDKPINTNDKRVDTQVLNKQPLGSDNTQEKEKNNCIIDDNLYSNLDYISIGDSWFDENQNKQFFYRIIVSSMGEEAYLYKELFEIKEEGFIQFINRKKIDPMKLSLQYFSSIPDFKWEDYNIVILTIDNKNYELQLDD